MDLLTWTVKWMRETVRTEVQMIVRDTGYAKEAPTQSATTKHPSGGGPAVSRRLFFFYQLLAILNKQQARCSYTTAGFF